MGEASLAKVFGSEADAAAAVEDRRDRQRAFLKRKSPGAGVQGSDWWPRKRHRKSAWQWLCALHNQISHVHPSGVLYFALPDDPTQRPPPLMWPRLSLSPDQGADGVSAICFMVHHLRCVVDVAFDPSHACWNDMLSGIKGAHLYEHLLLSMIRLNVPCGPWSEDMRYKQCVQGLQELLLTEGAESSPLFQAFLPEMLAEPAGRDLQGRPDAPTAMWRRLAEDNPFSTKGSKVVLGRFMDVLRRSKAELQHFHQRRFIYLYVALEGDMLSGSNFVKLALGSGQRSLKSTDSKRESSEEAALRKACCNQLALATMFMLDPDTEMIEWLLVATTEPWEQWHGRQNAVLRSCADSLPWLQQQLTGGFLETAAATFRATSNELTLKMCQFALPHRGLPVHNNDEGGVQRENDMSAHMAHLVLGINFARLRRCAWMLLGWSARSALFLLDSRARSHNQLVVGAVALSSGGWAGALGFALPIR